MITRASKQERHPPEAAQAGDGAELQLLDGHREAHLGVSPINDRYFSPLLGPTFSNRAYALSAPIALTPPPSPLDPGCAP